MLAQADFGFVVCVCDLAFLFNDITKTCLYNFDPLKPQFYIVKLGFTRAYIIFLISAQKHRLWYSLEPPRRGGSNEYPQSMFLSRNMKNIRFVLSENPHILVVKFSVYSNRHVFVMHDIFIPGIQPKRKACHQCICCWNLRYPGSVRVEKVRHHIYP